MWQPLQKIRMYHLGHYSTVQTLCPPNPLHYHIWHWYIGPYKTHRALKRSNISPEGPLEKKVFDWKFGSGTKSWQHPQIWMSICNMVGNILNLVSLHCLKMSSFLFIFVTQRGTCDSVCLNCQIDQVLQWKEKPFFWLKGWTGESQQIPTIKETI